MNGVDGKPSLASLAVLLLSASAIIGHAIWFDRSTSVTFDETFYVSCARQTVHDRRLDPRLAEYGVAPLPVVLFYLPPASFAADASRPRPNEGATDDPPLVSAARMLSAATAGLGLLLRVYVWLLRRAGSAAAALGAALVAGSPAVLAHASLATPDALFALCAVLSLAALAWYRAQPGSILRLLALAATIGLAISAKYSGVFLLPVAGLLLGKDAYYRANGSPVRRALLALVTTGGLTLLIAYSAFVFAWGFHGFAFSRPLDNVIWPIEQSRTQWLRGLGGLSVPTPIAGFLAQFLHNEQGHPAFFLGERSSTGWWTYFPGTLLLKSTPAEMLLALAAVVGGAWSVWAAPRNGIKFNVARDTWLCAAAVYLAFLMTARINIGHRYTLPLYPLLFLFVIDFLWPKLASAGWNSSHSWWLRGSTIRGALAACLASGQFLTSILTGPDKLSYFTPFIGGPQQGYRYLVDSNVDWGQDLPRLKAELDRLGHERVLLAYFGTARPQAYSITARDWRAVPEADLPQYEALAISVMLLQGLYTPGDDPFAPFRSLKPAARAGNSIMIYDLRSPAAQAALREARQR